MDHKDFPPFITTGLISSIICYGQITDMKAQPDKIIRNIYSQVLKHKNKIKLSIPAPEHYEFSIMEPYRFLFFFKIYKPSMLYTINPHMSQVKWFMNTNAFYRRWKE